MICHYFSNLSSFRLEASNQTEQYQIHQKETEKASSSSHRLLGYVYLLQIIAVWCIRILVISLHKFPLIFEIRQEFKSK